MAPLAIPALAVLVAAAPPAFQVQRTRFHKDDRMGAFAVQVTAPGFDPVHERLVAEPKDPKLFLVLPAAWDPDAGRTSASYFKEELSNAKADLAKQAKWAAAEKAAFEAAKRKKASTYRFDMDWGPREFEVARRQEALEELANRRSELETRVRNLEASAVIAEEREAAAKGLTVYGRFEGKGRAAFDLFVAPAHGPGERRPLGTVTLDLPAAPAKAPGILAAWAMAQLSALSELPQNGGELGRALARRSPALYGTPSDAEVQRFAPREANLYEAMSGSAAVREALQVDAMRRPVAESAEEVDVSTLSGPGIASHDYAALRKGATPRPLEAAAAVPADAWLLAASSPEAAFQTMDLLDAWGTDLVHAFEGSARDHGSRERIFRQLALPRTELSRFWAGKLVESLALTAHDPFVREGTDLTLILVAKDPEATRAAIELARGLAKAAAPGAATSKADHHGVAIETLATPDRAISSSLAVSGRFVLVGTSPAGLKACLDAIAGRSPSLASQPDFQYGRTVFTAPEDGFLFLSDAFVRNVVSPGWKLADQRRVACASHLEALEHGRLLALRDRRGKLSLEALQKEGYAPRDLSCPHGGAYALDERGASCSAHGRLSFLTPLVELPVTKISKAEAEAYERFVSGYLNYWQRFIDPVATRIRLGTPLELETVILPLVDNSIYTAFRGALSEAPAPLARQGETDKTIAAVSFALGQTELVKDVVEDWVKGRELGNSDPWKWLGDEVSLTIYDGDPLFTARGEDLTFLGGGGRNEAAGTMAAAAIISSLALPTAATVKVKDAALARQAMERLGARLEAEARDGRGGFGSPRMVRYRLGADDGVGVLSFSFFGITFRIYHAVVGDQLYLATRRWLVEDIQARGSALPADPDAVPGHYRVRIRHAQLNQARSAVQAGWGEAMREACFANLGDLELAHAALGGADPSAAVQRALGERPYCPIGGTYSIASDGHAACSAHGGPKSPRQPKALAEDTSTARWLDRYGELDLTLTFTPEGLRTLVKLVPAK